MTTRPTPKFHAIVSALTTVSRERKQLQQGDGLTFAAVANADAKLRSERRQECGDWAGQVHAWASGFLDSRNAYTIRSELMRPSHESCWMAVAALEIAHETWSGIHAVVHRLEINLDPERTKGLYRYVAWYNGTKVTHVPPLREERELNMHLSPLFLSELAAMTADGRIWDEFARHLEDRRQSIIDDR